MPLVIPDVTTCLTTNSTMAQESGLFACFTPFFCLLQFFLLPCKQLFLFADVGLRVGAETLPKSKVDNFPSFKKKLMFRYTTKTVVKPD